MLQAHPVGQPQQGKDRADEVTKFSGSVIGRGIVVNVIVNVALVNVGTDEKPILALCLAHGRFRFAQVGGHLPQRLQVQTLVKTVFHGLQGRPLGFLLVGLDVGGGHMTTPLYENSVARILNRQQ